jgi:hypothetical protein
MGLFDVFKKPKAEAKAPPAGPLMQALIERHGLEPGKPPEAAGYSGSWWEQPPNDDLLLAFMERGGNLIVFLGEPAEITEIYLVRERPGAWRLGAGNEMDFPELRLPAVKDGLAKLSAALEQFMVYETRDGVSLHYATDVTPEAIDADLETARAILNAVEK